MRLQAAAAGVMIMCATVCSPGVELYVSPDGSDSNAGTRSEPFATIDRARQAARRIKNKPVTVYLRGGTYYLAKTIVLGPQDSGARSAPVVYAAYKDERPVISGGTRLEVKWTRHERGIMKAEVPGAKRGKIDFDQLFIDGRRRHMARYPNHDPKRLPFGGASPEATSRRRAKRWADPAGGFVHAIHGSRWGSVHFRITGVDDSGKLKLTGGWQNNRPTGMHRDRFVENIFEELDAPGEWYLDRDGGVLYCMPPKGVDLNRARVEVAGLKHLIELRGSSKKAVRFITLRGLTFTHARRTFMETKEPLLRSDWRIYRGGAVLMEGAEDCAIADCFFDAVGGNAVFVSNYNRRVKISGCKITEAGASGICFVGSPKAVRSPLYDAHHQRKFEDVDKTPGPKTDEYPGECVAHDNLIHTIGVFEKQVAGVQISMSQEITVSHNSIYRVPRAGINIGNGTWGGHLIEYNDVFDTVRETSDHGSFNSWGRDRYWHSGVENSIDKHPDAPKLDAWKTTVIRNNRWRCDHGWDIDLDDGSTNYHIYNNLCLRGGIKLREGFYRKVENNIMVGGTFHPHVWYAGSADVVRRNIVFRRYRPVRVQKPWGRQIDYNLLHAPGKSGPAKELQAQSGRDEHSIVGDGMFVDPGKGDYCVKDGSPALTVGFKNFPMDRFGVRSPRLRAEAKTPFDTRVGAAGRKAGKSKRSRRKVGWLGATIKDLTGMDEMSGTGMGSETGVLVLEAPADSAAAKLGLTAGDVILGLNGPAPTVDELVKNYKSAAAGKELKIKLWRDQKARTFTRKKP